MNETKKQRSPMTVKEARKFLGGCHCAGEHDPEKCTGKPKSEKTIYRLVKRRVIGASTKLRHLMLNRDDVENLGAPAR